VSHADPETDRCISWLGGNAERVGPASLVSRGFNVVVFARLAGDLEAAAACRRRVMLLIPTHGDQVLPVVSDLVGRVRRTIKVLVLVPDRRQLAIALGAGAADAMVRDVEVEELVGRVRVWLDRALFERRQNLLLATALTEEATLRGNVHQLMESRDRLLQLAAVDPITELLDAIGFRDRAQALLAVCARLEGGAALLAIRFAGPVARSQTTIERSCRAGDLLGSLRPRELVLLLPAVGARAAVRIARRLHQRLVAADPTHDTAFGVANIERIERGRPAQSIELLLWQARTAARHAEAGAQVVVFDRVGTQAA
jgi:PleD family two-component response regulator